MNNTLQTIILITAGQPSINPRLVKEADTLFNAGYKVTVIYQYWNDWATQMDEGLLAEKRWEAIRVGGSPNKNPFDYWVSKNLYRARRAVNKLFGGRFLPADLLIGRCTRLLCDEAGKHKADLYIAHNLAALPAAVKAARKYNTRSGFDAEDFHRNETSNDANDPDVKLKSTIEDKYIPQVNYISASSPGIGDAYRQIFPGKNPVVILNAFPIDNKIIVKDSSSSTLKLFWFSQTIGPRRGIEDIINALKIVNDSKIELHLLGDLPPSAKSYFADIGAENVHVHIHPPITPDRINEFASQFDIGLALEPGFCLNNDLALSNKIFTYMQAGLAIIASDTTAQSLLLNQYPDIGKHYQSGDIGSLAGAISYYQQNRDQLFKAQKASLALGREKLNWENESLTFLNAVASVIK